ncbi:PQ loop repeat-domain-containing protein [Lipomyces kononenkoae]|uniref:PQ loop repeat-domain-containing protein n=1 Tax=Lipomyces kononenkoae TaxID=34357 RepID=A0ACC3TAJ5_LIPKO
MNDTINGCPLRNEVDLELVQWIARATGSCMYGEMGAFSYILGYLSLFSWLWAQLPQVIKNYRNHSVEGLSWLFLFNWFLGDATNLIGCLLTQQLPFQTFLAIYYLSIDVILCGQYIYYTNVKSEAYYVLLSPREAGTPRSSSESSHTIRSNGRRRANVMLSLSAIVAIAGAMVTPPTPNGPALLPPAMSAGDGMVSIMEGKFNGFRRWFKLTDREFVGRVFAWACTTMYLTSRMPQIYTNFARQSTSGLSVLLFIAAFLGNTFYTLSILSSAATLDPSPGGERAIFLWEELPYLLGSAGTVGFDLTIFLQWIYYGEGKLFFHNLYYGRKSWELAENTDDADAQSLVDEDEYRAASSSSSSASSGSSQTVSSIHQPAEVREAN